MQWIQIDKAANQVCTQRSGYIVLGCSSLCRSWRSNWTRRLSRWCSLQILSLNLWRPEMRWYPRVRMWDSRPSELPFRADHSPATVLTGKRGRLMIVLNFSTITGCTATDRDVKRGSRVCSSVRQFRWSRINHCRRGEGWWGEVVTKQEPWADERSRWNISFWYS